MLQNIKGQNTILSTELQKTIKQTIPKVAIDNVLMQNQDSYVKTSTSLIPDLYSNKTDEAISPDEYEKYCGITTLSDGTALYFPPENSSYTEKKAWVDGFKKLEAEGKGGEIACIKLGIIHEIREQNNLPADDLSNNLKLAVNASSGTSKKILMELLDEEKDQLNMGGYSGVDQETSQKLQQGHIDALETVLDFF